MSSQHLGTSLHIDSLGGLTDTGTPIECPPEEGDDNKKEGGDDNSEGADDDKEGNDSEGEEVIVDDGSSDDDTDNDVNKTSGPNSTNEGEINEKGDPYVPSGSGRCKD